MQAPLKMNNVVFTQDEQNEGDVFVQVEQGSSHPQVPSGKLYLLRGQLETQTPLFL